MKTFVQYISEEYKTKNSGEKAYTHLGDKPIVHVYHKGEKIASIEPRSAYGTKRGSVKRTSAIQKVKYTIRFDKPEHNRGLETNDKIGSTSSKEALNKIIKHHQSITESLQESAADLNDALKDLKNTLASDGYSPNVVKQVADDWDVNPALLARKFKEATGKDPQDFQMADKESLGKAQFEAGKRKAREWVAKNIRGGESPLEGKPFTFVDKKANQSYQLVASAWTGTKLHAWNITKNSFWEITFPNVGAAAKYIDAHLLSVK